MEAQKTQDITPMLSEQDLANRWGISVRTLQDWRYKKTGPEFIKFGGWTVRYPLKAVIGYEEKATKHPQ
jgi:hypothetical protein